MQNISLAVEPYRRRVVAGVFAIYLILIFDGVLRKWVLPGFSSAILFLRDPVVIYVYIAAMSACSIVSRRSIQVSLFVACIIIIGAAVQLLSSDISPVVVGYGLRNYAFLLPLPFVIASNFDKRDYGSLMRLIVVTGLPISALGIVQSYLPIDSFWNRGVGNAEIFTAGDQARTYGTFTFTAGFSLYLGLLFSVSLCVSRGLDDLSPANKLLGFTGIIFSTAAIATSGSRFALSLVALTLFALLMVGIAEFLLGRPKATETFASVGLLIAVAVVSLGLFSEQIGNLVFRFEASAESGESLVERLSAPMIETWDAATGAPLFGNGLGLGTGGGSFLATGAQQFLLSEDEPPRIMQEAGPLVGTIYLLFRWSVLATLIGVALRELFREANASPLLIVAPLILLLAQGQVTGQTTLGGLCWFSVGLILTATKSVRSS